MEEQSEPLSVPVTELLREALEGFTAITSGRLAKIDQDPLLMPFKMLAACLVAVRTGQTSDQMCLPQILKDCIIAVRDGGFKGKFSAAETVRLIKEYLTQGIHELEPEALLADPVTV